MLLLLRGLIFFFLLHCNGKKEVGKMAAAASGEKNVTNVENVMRVILYFRSLGKRVRCVPAENSYLLFLPVVESEIR